MQRVGSGGSAWRGVAGLVGVWLVVSPWVLPGPSELVAAKDVGVGLVLMTVAASAAVDRQVRRVEAPVLLVLGLLLITASVVLEFGSDPSAVARQWNEVVIGVVLVYLAAARLERE